MERTQLAFRLLEQLCHHPLAHADGLLPIEFELKDSTPDLRFWNLDPGRTQRLFAPGRHPCPALRVQCTPQLLLCWAFPRAKLHAEPPRLVGQLDALRRLARALAAAPAPDVKGLP